MFSYFPPKTGGQRGWNNYLPSVIGMGPCCSRLLLANLQNTAPVNLRFCSHADDIRPGRVGLYQRLWWWESYVVCNNEMCGQQGYRNVVWPCWCHEQIQGVSGLLVKGMYLYVNYSLIWSSLTRSILPSCIFCHVRYNLACPCLEWSVLNRLG